MILDIEFQESNCEFDVEFEEAHEVSDGGYEKGYADGNAAGYEAGHTDGRTEGYQQGRAEDGTQYATQVIFENGSLFDKPEMELTVGDKTAFQFKGENTIVKHLTINGNRPTVSWNSALRVTGDNDTTMERLTLNIDLSKVTDFSYLLRGRRHLKVIDGQPIDFSSATSIGTYFVYVCNSLEEIRVVPGSIHVSLGFGTSAKLSDASVQSIIDGLADLTGQTTQTLDLHVSNQQKLTNEQIATITQKNWSVV